MRALQILILSMMLLLSVPAAFAAPVRLYVADINAVGSQNRDEMKGMLQSLLASRVSGGKYLAVGDRKSVV